MLAELYRRRVFRTVALYVVSSWLLLQLADTVFANNPDAATFDVFGRSYQPALYFRL